MEGPVSFVVISVLIFISTLTTVFASNCYGGHIVSSVLIGGSNAEYGYDIVSTKNDIIMLGSTGSSDLPYDDSFMYDELTHPEDVYTSVLPVSDTTVHQTFLTSGLNFDDAYLMDIDGDYICVTGTTNSGDGFPTNSAYSYYSYSSAVFLQTFNSSNPTQMLLTLQVGDDYDIDYVSVACADSFGTAFLVSGSGNGGSYKRGLNDYDARVSFVNLTDGNTIADVYFGAVGTDDKPLAADFYQRGTNGYLLIVGNTFSSGINDSFPIVNAYQPTNNGSQDGFVWVGNVNNPNNITWEFATFIGGNDTENVYDTTFDESGNVYVVGQTNSLDYPLKNAIEPNFCNDTACGFLSIFNFQGKLLMSTYLGINVGWVAVTTQRLSDGGHLVYLNGYTSTLVNSTIESFQYTLTNSSVNSADAFVKVYYLSSDFTAVEERLFTFFGGSGDELSYGITVLPNNRFAIVGSTMSNDFPLAGNYTPLVYYDSFVTVFECGAGLYTVHPSPTPVASQVPPSPPPVTCQAQDGCYSAPGVYVQFEQGDDGEFVPTQTLYPGDGNSVQENYYLNAEYLTLEEKDSNGNLIVSIPFPTSGYSLTSQNQIINGVNVTVVTFSTTMANGAEVDVINYFFPEDGSLEFAGTAVPVTGGAIKVSLLIKAWSFVDTTNTLTLTILLDIAPPPKGSATSSTTGNQTTFSWDTGKTNCVVTSLSVVDIDDETKQCQTAVTSTTVQVTFPYFTDYVLYDPGYQVLVKDDKSSSPKDQISPWAYVGVALGAVVVVAASVGVGFVFMNRRKRRTAKALSYKGNNEVEMQ